MIVIDLGVALATWLICGLYPGIYEGVVLALLASWPGVAGLNRVLGSVVLCMLCPCILLLFGGTLISLNGLSVIRCSLRQGIVLLKLFVPNGKNFVKAILRALYCASFC